MAATQSWNALRAIATGSSRACFIRTERISAARSDATARPPRSQLLVCTAAMPWSRSVAQRAAAVRRRRAWSHADRRLVRAPPGAAWVHRRDAVAPRASINVGLRQDGCPPTWNQEASADADHEARHRGAAVGRPCSRGRGCRQLRRYLHRGQGQQEARQRVEDCLENSISSSSPSAQPDTAYECRVVGKHTSAIAFVHNGGKGEVFEGARDPGPLARIGHERPAAPRFGPLICPPEQRFFGLLKDKEPTREDHLEGDARWAPSNRRSHVGRTRVGVARRQRPVGPGRGQDRPYARVVAGAD